MENENSNTENSNDQGIGQITLEQFRALELIRWVDLHDSGIGLRHRLEEYDALICTDEAESAHLWDLDELIADGAQIGVPFAKNNSKIILYKSLTPQILRKEEMLETKDLRQFSYYQHQLLRGMLYTVDEYFRLFLKHLYSVKKDKLPVANSNSESAIAMINYMIDFLTETSIKKREPLIPDLYTFHGDTSLMSFNDKYVYELLEGQRDGKKYTYMFSRTTSENFATILMEILNRKLADQKLLAAFDSTDKNKVEEDYKLPTTAKERLKYLVDFYKLNALSRTNRLSHTSAQLMFLFRILQDDKLILDNIPKEELCLAISILTGISTNTIYNDYAFDEPFDYGKMAGSVNSEKINAAKNIICDAVVGAFIKSGKRRL